MWDQDQETAGQSPLGGTKVAWGGPPLQPKHGRNRQRFDLAVTRIASWSGVTVTVEDPLYVRHGPTAQLAASRGPGVRRAKPSPVTLTVSRRTAMAL